MAKFNDQDIQKFNGEYIFIPKYFRTSWGDDGLNPCEDYVEGEDCIDEIEALTGDLKAQADTMYDIGEDLFGTTFDFVTLMSRDRYEDNLAGTGCENINGGVEDYNAVLICAFEGYAPTHQVVGFEIAGTIERVNPNPTGLEVLCAW